MRLFTSGHARRDRCQHQDAFEAFAENENANVQKRHRRTSLRLGWVRRAMGGQPLPYDHRDHASRSHEDANPESGPGDAVS
jgi:hypothetical protein